MPTLPASTSFQIRLSARILALLGAACLTAPASGCGSRAPGSSSSTGGGTATGSGATSTVSTVSSGTGSATGTGGATGGGSAGDGGVVDAAMDAASDAPALTGSKVCLAWPLPIVTDPDAGDPDAGDDAGGPIASTDAGSACPTDPKEVLVDFQNIGCPHGWEPNNVLSGPMTPDPTMGECCYTCTIALCGPGGRPYLDRGEALLAPAERSEGADGWREGASPRLEGLSAEARSRLATAWTEDALREHASVASFARAALALLGAGAPADLVVRTHEAALDEVRHAQRCFALASAYAGEALRPGRFPIGDRVPVAATLAEIAASAVEEGCVGETVAAMAAAEQLARATDPAVRAALAGIAEDEARHAELAWQTVAWAVRTGGPEVRAAVAGAFSRAAGAARRANEERGVDTMDPALSAHGRLGPAALAEVIVATMTLVVAPAVKALLAPGVTAAPASLHA